MKKELEEMRRQMAELSKPKPAAAPQQPVVVNIHQSEKQTPKKSEGGKINWLDL